MAITINTATASSTFADLITDSDSGTTTYYNIWTGVESGGVYTGNFVDASAFAAFGEGWISAADLASLNPDYAQANDTEIWVQTYNETDGVSAWQGGSVVFGDIATVSVTTSIDVITPFDEMFNDADVESGTWYQFWIGDAAGTSGAYADFSATLSYTGGYEAQGWVQVDDLGLVSYDPNAYTGDTIWVQTYTPSNGVMGNWESWTVTANVGGSYTLSEQIETTTGTGGDDTFNAYTKYVAGVGQTATLQSGDTVNGSGGTDTLNADLFGGGTVVPTLNGVENLVLSDYNGMTLDLSGVTGMTSVNYRLLIGNTTLNNASSIFDLSATNITGDRDITVAFLDDAVSGTADTLNVGVTASDLDDLILNNTTNLGIETLNINVGSGTSSIDTVQGTAVATPLANVMVTGAGHLTSDLTNGGANTSLITVDGSAATGNLKLTVGVAQDQTIKSGAGNDVLTFGATLTDKDTVDGGSGTDRIVGTGDLNKTSYSKVTNVEEVQMTTDGGDGGTTDTLNAGGFSGATTFVGQIQNAQTTNSDDISITGLAATASVTIQNNKDDATGDGTIDDVTIAGANTTGADDTLSLTLNGARADKSLAINDLTANGYETINIMSTGVTPNANTIGNFITATLTDTSLTKLVATGDRMLDIDGFALATKTIDASAMTASFAVQLGAANQTVTGGSGDDTVTIDPANLTKDDTINAGAGTDTLAFSADADFSGSTNAAKLGGVSNFEKIGLGAASVDLKLDDISMGAFSNATVAIAVTGDVTGTTVDVQNVKGSNSNISVDTTKITTAGNTHNFSISNGNDTLVGGAGEDTVTIEDTVYIGKGDSLAGGAGNNNVLSFEDQGAAATLTFAASQFTGVTGFDAWTINDVADAGFDEVFDITIDDAVAKNNSDTTDGTLTVSLSANAVNDDTLKLDASAVSGSTHFVVTGGDAADTIKTGAGNDEITGGAAADIITTGTGKDDVNITTSATADTITDFNFGAAAGKTDANVDQLDVKALAVAANFNGNDFDVVQIATASNTATAADTDVLILTYQGFTDVAAVDVHLEANNSGTVDDDLIVVYQDTLGQVRVAWANGDETGAESGGADYTTADIAILTGLTVSGVSTIVDVGDFLVA